MIHKLAPNKQKIISVFYELFLFASGIFYSEKIYLGYVPMDRTRIKNVSSPKLICAMFAVEGFFMRNRKNAFERRNVHAL